MTGLPSGTLTFLFTDIEGSTRLLQQLGNRYADVLVDYRQLLRAAVQERGGQEVDTQGDAFFFAFPSAREALLAAIKAQQSLLRHPWIDGMSVRVRMGLHTGEARVAETGYVGMDVHRAARICSAGHGGQILLSDATHALVANDLPGGITLRDLGEHRLKDLAQPQHLFQIVASDLPVEFPPLKSLNVLPNNLPMQLTSFVGRAREMSEIKDLLRTTRLLTLVGAGGSGKTRLALQIAADLLDEHPDGVWWIDLAPLADPGMVPQATAAALNIREQSDRPVMDSLLDYLRHRHALLLLDNCEHLLLPCARLADTVLRRCPGVRIMVTSREGLATAGETLYPVPVLSLPDPTPSPALEVLSKFEAVRLFTDRAGSVVPTFRLTERNAGVVGQICHRLDGIPLAIELAAARVAALSLEQIAARLDDQFRFLTGGSRIALPRHQTLQAALDWSFQSLTEAEKVVFRRLAVFAGGFTLTAAEEVCPGEGLPVSDILEPLTHLVAKSLVLAEDQQDERRFRMLEPIRQFARDRLREAGEVEEVRERHLDWLLPIAEEGERQLRGHGQLLWLRRLEREHGNFRGALEWAFATDRSETALRLASALATFWQLRGHITEGRTRLEEALGRGMASTALPALRAKALADAAELAEVQHDHKRAEELARQSLALATELGDRRGEACALRLLGGVARWHSDFARAATFFQDALARYQEAHDEWGIAASFRSIGGVARAQKSYVEAATRYTIALNLFRKVGDRWETANTLYFMGLTARAQGAFAQATAYAEEALALSREMDDAYSAAHALHLLGTLAWYQGDHDRAAALHAQSLPMFEELGDWNCVATTTTDLGLVAHQRGDLQRAVALHKDALRRRHELEDKPGVAECLERLAGVIGRQTGEPAARLLGAAEAIRAALGVPRSPVEQPGYERLVTTLQASLGETAFMTAWAAGREMAVGQAVHYALEEN